MKRSIANTMLFTVLLCSGCTLFSSPFSSSPEQRTSRNTVGNQQKARSVPQPVEILWKIPSQPVDGFIIRYGLTNERLDREIKVTERELTKYEDPGYGFVYRYVLRGVPINQPLFVSISSYQGEKISSRSELFTLIPEEFPLQAPL